MKLEPIAALILLAAAVVCSGCGEAPPPTSRTLTVKCTGQEPIAGVIVTLREDAESDVLATGRSDESGQVEFLDVTAERIHIDVRLPALLDPEPTPDSACRTPPQEGLAPDPEPTAFEVPDDCEQSLLVQKPPLRPSPTFEDVEKWWNSLSKTQQKDIQRYQFRDQSP